MAVAKGLHFKRLLFFVGAGLDRDYMTIIDLIAV